LFLNNLVSTGNTKIINSPQTNQAENGAGSGIRTHEPLRDRSSAAYFFNVLARNTKATSIYMHPQSCAFNDFIIFDLAWQPPLN